MDGRAGREERPWATHAGARLRCYRACPAVGTWRFAVRVRFRIRQRASAPSSVDQECKQRSKVAQAGLPWYDSSMTAAKIAITLPREQLAKVRHAVRSGQASSVSGYIAGALAEKEQRESLRALLAELKAEHGEPTKREVSWAKRALARSWRK